MPISRSGIKIVSFVPTLDTNAYATGDQLGPASTKLSKIVFGKPGNAMLSSVTILDSAKQSQPIDLIFFNSQPTVTSVDNAAFDVSDAELAAKCVGAVSLLAADYKALNANSVATVRDLELFMNSIINTANPEGDSLWVSLVIRGAGTYAANSLKLILTFGN